MSGSRGDDITTYELWVCRGRVCTANGSGALATTCTALASSSSRATVHPGGCYGLCELGPNVVVRRRRGEASAHLEDADRLSLIGGPDETVYCAVAVDDVAAILTAHLEHDAPLQRLTRAVRERERAPRTLVEERIRSLRAARARADSSDRQDSDDDNTGGSP